MKKAFKFILALSFYFNGIFAYGEVSQVHEKFINSVPSIMPTNGMRAETIYMMRCMEELHFNHRDVALLDHKAILIDYISELDPHRMILLQKEVDDFVRRFSATLDIFVNGGSLMPAFTIFDQYRKDAYTRLDWIQERLRGEWDFSVDETYIFNRKDATWPGSKFEADTLWEKRLKHELLNEMMSSEYKLSNKTEQASSKNVADGNEKRSKKAFTAAVDIVSKRYKSLLNDLKTFDSWLIEEFFLNSISHMYDPHSSFLSKTTLDDFNIILSNSLVGIGITLFDENGMCTIRALHPGGPASMSKNLRVGDKILAVAQGEDGEFVDIVGMRLYKLVKLIRGEKGTVVRLKVQPVDAASGNYKIIALVRDEIHVTESRANGKLFSFSEGDKKINIGVINLPAFYGNDPKSAVQDTDTASDMKYLINEMKKRNIDGLIIDLRQNSGGFLDQAVAVSGLFIVNGPVVQVCNSFGSIENLCDEDSSIEWDGLLIALTSSHSASASEILVGALHDHHRAIIVGDPTTHGKGSVQAVLPMNRFFNTLHGKDELGAVRVTMQKWYLPSGGSTQLRGVPADITLPSIEAYLPIKESDFPHALSWDSITEAKFNYEEAAKKSNYFVDPGVIELLRKNVKSRMDSMEEFYVLNKQIAHFCENFNQKEISLKLGKRRKQSLAELEFKRELKGELEELIKKSDIKCEKICLKDDFSSEKDEIYDPNKDDALPEFDVQLRECLRIMEDWVNLPNAKVSGKL